MSSEILPAMTYQNHPQARRFTSRNTIIEDEPQETRHIVPNQRRYTRLSTIVDDSPVSDAMAFNPNTTLQQRRQQPACKPVAFNDLYDMTDDEQEDLPIRFSTSSLQGTPTQAAYAGKRFPSLVIPSPSTWPTIHNFKKGDDAPLLSPGVLSPTLLSPTPQALSKLSAQLYDNNSSSAPSLDGSLTSEELSNMSCPSTPDIDRPRDESDWGSSPVQLHPQALQTLDSIVGMESQVHSPIMYVAEMREVEEQRPQLGLNVDMPSMSAVEADTTELSALSVPSPGGFFSTLEPSTRHAWLPTPTEQPSTTIAERFYGVPWLPEAAAEPLEQVVEIEFEDTNTEGPPTARWNPLVSPRPALIANNSDETVVADIMIDPTEYKDTYQEELREVSSANLDRTAMWLQSQGSFSGSDDDEVADAFNATLPSSRNSMSSIESVLPQSSTPKSVRFAIESIAEVAEEESPVVPPKDATFVQSFEHLNEARNAADTFVHRKARTEALRLDRKCLFTSHVNRLEGKFDVEKEKPTRPVSDFFGGGELSEESDAIAVATKERRALEQVKPIAWNLEATKMLNGGTLLTSPTGKLFPTLENGRILDLGGQASCDWAWQVALEHQSSTVHTVYTGEQSIDSTLQAPKNHKSTCVPNLWTLPFPSDHFHLISARSLFSLLKTDKPAGSRQDEYDLCLAECMRVLKPGGYLEFALVDADIMGAGRQASALSVEFSFNLKTRGYDCTPTKQWLPRLRRAGFTNVRRAWLTLPLTQSATKEGTTADASHISGLVGSWAWERWMLKLHKEMGKDADRLLEGVPAAMEEGARTGAMWRYLSGWARKPM